VIEKDAHGMVLAFEIFGIEFSLVLMGDESHEIFISVFCYAYTDMASTLMRTTFYLICSIDSFWIFPQLHIFLNPTPF
jgi:hypothetical protein